MIIILGVGTDLCRIDRIERAVRSEHFRDRVFSPEEVRYAQEQGSAAHHYAASFAAKEALSKALGIGIFRMGASSAWVERTDAGPVMRASDAAKESLDVRGVSNIWLSLTHEGEYALAFVVLEGGEKK